MKSKHYLILLAFFVSAATFAQRAINPTNDAHWSIEGSAGIHIPLAPSDFISTGDYVAFKQYQLSLRYMFNGRYGLKGSFSRNRFEDKNDHSLGVTYNRLSLEGVMNLGNTMNFLRQSNLSLLGHFGGGLTWATPPSGEDKYDNFGNLMLGITGLIPVANGIDILTDVTLVKNFAVQHAYNGEFLDTDLPHNGYGGAFVNVSLGIVIYLDN